MSNTSLVLQPLPMVVYEDTLEASAFPSSNSLSNRYGLVARSTQANAGDIFQIRYDLGETRVVDTVAALWHNLRDGDAIRFRVSTTSDFSTGNVSSGFLVPKSGQSASSEARPSKLVYQFAAPESCRYVEISFQTVGTNHPDGYMQVSRVLAGKAIQIGVGPQNLEHDVSDPGEVIINEAGYESADEGGLRVPMIKATYEWATEAEFKADLRPFVADVGRTKPFLYIPDFTDPNVQDAIVFGRNRSPALSSSKFDIWKQEIHVKSIGP